METLFIIALLSISGLFIVVSSLIPRSICIVFDTIAIQKTSPTLNNLMLIEMKINTQNSVETQFI